MLAELAAIRAAFGTIHVELGAVRSEQAAIRRDIAALDSRLTTLDSRLTTLEERVDARLHETGPIWEAIQLSIEKLDEKFDNVIREPLRSSRRRGLARKTAQRNRASIEQLTVSLE